MTLDRETKDLLEQRQCARVVWDVVHQQDFSAQG